MNDSVKDILLKSQQGDVESRELLISKYKNFILQAASNICKRKITWDDDEASISLIAFNEAIDRYNEHYGKSFNNYAFMLIRSRLIDEFRRERKKIEMESLSLDDNADFALSAVEVASAVAAHKLDESSTELASELNRFDKTLQEYGIDLIELEECCPDHRDTRIKLIRIAKRFSAYPALLEQLFRNKRLPIKEMLPYVEVSRKTLERNRKYLIALILIFGSEEFAGIRNAISFAEIGE